jgi:glutamate-5-semialdehyde dehydrogenase
VILNGKSRLSVCNAIDKVIINTNLPNFKEKAEILIKELMKINIEVITDGAQLEKFGGVTKMTDNLYAEEFLSPKILISETNDIEDAIATINKYSGGHSAVIIASNDSTSEDFQNRVDCAAVYQNASSRFTDGGQLGFGAEIAISTQKLHFRGPVGTGQLVTNKWFIKGNGQIRG